MSLISQQVAFFILMLPLLWSPPAWACRHVIDEFGFALLGHAYKTLTAANFSHCFAPCTLEERCQSVTYLWVEKDCLLNNATKQSRPEAFTEHPAATYMENSFRVSALKGSNLVPGHSCKDIFASSDGLEDGEYWIDPTASGDPFKVFCDMTTSKGGWTLLVRSWKRHKRSWGRGDAHSYRRVLSRFNSNNQYLSRSGMRQLRTDMGFTQIRFYCFTNKTSRVLHIMTNTNDLGKKVLDFFTTSNTMPRACGSFITLPDDNSTLAKNCEEWGYPTQDRWGHSSELNGYRLYRFPFTWPNTSFFRMYQSFNCDSKDETVSLGDIWQIYVR